MCCGTSGSCQLVATCKIEMHCLIVWIVWNIVSSNLARTQTFFLLFYHWHCRLVCWLQDLICDFLQRLSTNFLQKTIKHFVVFHTIKFGVVESV